MENTPPLRYPRKSIPSQINSQGYAKLSPTKEHEHCDDTRVSPMSSRRNFFPSNKVSQPALETTSTDIEAYSSNNSDSVTCNAQQYETTVISVGSDVADKNSQSQSQSQSHSRHILEILTKFWLWEIAACTFSLISLASIVGVLIYEDGKQLDQWTWSVPPTAVVSFIGTLGKASLALVISQLLSQLKWLYFNHSSTRSLRHLRTFDNGSRGPLGAVLVVYNSKKLLASITACLMILTILVDPFVQLVFIFPSRVVEDDSQQAAFQRLYNWTSESGPIEGTPSQRIWSSMNQGLTLTGTNPTATCPTGNCTWPGPIKTLGVCGSCSNVTSTTKVDCSTENQNLTRDSSGPGITLLTTCNYIFDDSVTLQAQQLYYLSSPVREFIDRTLWNSSINPPTWLPDKYLTFVRNKTLIELDGQYAKETEFLNLEGGLSPSQSLSIFNGSIIGFNVIQLPVVSELPELPANFTLPQARCWSCEMYWCEKSFENVRAIGNTPPTYVVSAQRLWFVQASSDFGVYPSEVDGLNRSAVWNFKYRVDNIGDMANYLGNLFYSYYAQSPDLSAVNLNGTIPEPQSYYRPAQYDLKANPGALKGLVFSDDLNATINRLADSLSESIRTGPNATNVTGQALVAKSFIHVRWSWLALPLALMTTTCILLPIVAIKSRSEKVPIWKDDPLALLFHHIDAVDIAAESDGKTGSTDLNDLADELYVKLDKDRPFTFIKSVGEFERRRKRKRK